MNFLNRVEVQEYVDNEISADRRAEIEKHLLTCPDCRKKYEDAMEDKELINSLLNQLNNDTDVQPSEFIYPDMKTGKHITRLVISFIAAASILTFIFLFQKNTDIVSENVQDSERLVREFYEGKDLNKMWHDNSQILILQDADGNIESVLTN